MIKKFRHFCIVFFQRFPKKFKVKGATKKPSFLSRINSTEPMFTKMTYFPKDSGFQSSVVEHPGSKSEFGKRRGKLTPIAVLAEKKKEENTKERKRKYFYIHIMCLSFKCFALWKNLCFILQVKYELLFYKKNGCLTVFLQFLHRSLLFKEK